MIARMIRACDAAESTADGRGPSRRTQAASALLSRGSDVAPSCRPFFLNHGPSSDGIAGFQRRAPDATGRDPWPRNARSVDQDRIPWAHANARRIANPRISPTWMYGSWRSASNHTSVLKGTAVNPQPYAGYQNTVEIG